MKNYYEILGVSQKSSIDEIKKSYLSKIKKYHPDVFVGDKIFAEKQTALINEAFATLKDEHLRANYDYKLFKQSQEKAKQKPKEKQSQSKQDTQEKKEHTEQKQTSKQTPPKDTKEKEQQKPKSQQEKHAEKSPKSVRAELLDEKSKHERTLLDLSIAIVAIMLLTIIILAIAL